GTAEKYGLDKAALKQMVEAVIREAEKKAREDRGELRRREDRAEKKAERRERDADRRDERRARDDARRAERRAREDERLELEARKEAEKDEAKRVKREAAFAEIVDLPKLTHEMRLREAAKKLGEDFDFLVGEFEVYFAAREVTADLTPWPDSVNTAELLAEI